MTYANNESKKQFDEAFKTARSHYEKKSRQELLSECAHCEIEQAGMAKEITALKAERDYWQDSARKHNDKAVQFMVERDRYRQVLEDCKKILR